MHGTDGWGAAVMSSAADVCTPGKLQKAYRVDGSWVRTRITR